MSMAERLIYAVIEAGLSYYTEDSGQRFERFLREDLRLSVAEAAKGKVYFAGGTNSEGDTIEARPPTLIHGYARTGGPFPCWALTLGGENVAQRFLGDDAVPLDEDGDRIFDPETGEVVDPKVRYVTYTFNVLVIAEHPDVTLWYYSLLKAIILSQREAFLNQDLSVPEISGADLAPDPRYLPHDMFARQLTITVDGEEYWAEARTGFGGSVSIAIDDTGTEATEGEGSVTAKVTTFAGS